MPSKATNRTEWADGGRPGPTVAFFSNQFADSKGHGLARYARELYGELRALPETDVVPVAAWSSLSADALSAHQADTGLLMTGLGRNGTKLLWTFLNQPPIEHCIGRPVDVVHAVSLGYPVATRKPLVVTIHDLGPLTHPDFFRNTRPWVMKRSLEQAVRHADAIVCISKSTAEEVLTYVGTHIEDRVQVVLEGVHPRFFEPASSQLPATLQNLPEDHPFILSTGQISPRKNIQGLIAAFARIKSEIPHHLVLVGGMGWDSYIVEAHLRDADLRSRVHFPGFVTDDQLRTLYQMADIYVHPSLYEGFGLPVLEAMASGTPVVVSNRSSLPEVAGDAGRLSDTTDPEALGADIVDICRSPSLRARMSEAGKAHAARFRWEDCAKEMADIYRSVARLGSRNAKGI